MADIGTKISELPDADTLTGTEQIPGVQSGQTKKATAAQIATLVKSGLTKDDVGLSNVANVLQYSAQNPPPTDAVPTEDSTKLVESGGVYVAILALLPTDTASGNPANFPDGAGGIPVVDLTVSIRPAQSGSGDPTPDNVRPVSGWTGLTLYHSGADTSDPETLSVSWQSQAGTVYVGTLDITTGVLTVTHGLVELDELSWSYYGYFVSTVDDIFVRGAANVTPDIVCSCYSPAPPNMVVTGTSGNDKIAFGVSAPQIIIRDNDQTDVTAFAASLTGQVALLPLVTSETYQLTPTEVQTLLGENNVWADSGAVTVEYRADLAKYIDKKTS